MRFTRSSERTCFLAILAGAIALRVVALGRADLWTDEIQTLHAVRLDVDAMVRERLAAGHVPVYFLIEKAWCSLFGTSQFALRLPSAIFGAALLIPARSLFRRLAGEKAAWAGAALVAAHPLFIELSREARMYSLLGLLAFVVADRVVATLDGERPGASFWVAAAVGPFVHPTWGVAVLPLAAWLAAERRGASADSKRTSRAALAGLAASLAVLGVALAFAAPQHQELTRRPWPREIGVFLLRVFAGSDLSDFHETLPRVVLVVAWASTLVAGARLADGRQLRFAAWIGLGVPAASVAAGLAGGVPWGPARYVAFAAVGFVLVAAIAARPHFPVMAVTMPILLLVMSLGRTADRTVWSEAAKRLPDDSLPVVVDDEPTRIVLSHYLGRDVHVGAPPPDAATWRHVSYGVGLGRRRVRTTTETRPR